MSNDWINIRFGCHHVHAERWWRNWSIGLNEFHKDNPKRFEVYTLWPFI